MKLIITDLDNTLLKSDKTISEYTVKVFEKCREKGYSIAFASARSEPAMARFIKAIKPEIIVSNGGAIIKAAGNVIYQNQMSAQEVSTILKMCRHFTNDKGLITLDCEDGYYCSFVPYDPDRYNGYVYSDFKYFEKPAYKITAELENDAWGDEIIRACPDCTIISFTGEKWRRFAANGSDKATALQTLVNYFGINLSDIIAFGDDTNDLGMLNLAGTAVAVSNAIEKVKAAADYITDSNDQDGVAMYLEKTVLK